MSSHIGSAVAPRRTTRRVCSFAAVALLLFATVAAGGGDWQPARLWAAASGKYLWVVGASSAEPGRFAAIRMWIGETEPRLESPRPSWRLPPIDGDILALGADRDGLHLLFSDLSVRDYIADRGGTAGARWRDVSNEPPLAWGGDSSRPAFWALAKTENLVPASTRPTTQTSDSDDETTPSISISPPPGGPLTIVEQRDGLWRFLETPDEADNADRFWLTGYQGQAWLFWQTDGQIWSSSGPATAGTQPSSQPATTTAKHGKRQARGAALGGWSSPERVCKTDDLRAAWAGAGSAGPVFIAGRGSSERRVQLQLYMHEGEGWTSSGAARDGTELLEVDAKVSGVCAAKGRLLIARSTKEKGLELGIGDLGPSPSVRFSALTLSTTESPESSPWRDSILFGVVLVLMTIVMWTRREQMTQPLAMPAGLILAPVMRRLLATIIDALPAMVVAMSLMVSTIPSTAWPLDASPLTGINVDPETADRLMSIYYGSVLLYGVWCLAWELLLGTTPGKLVFGCRVLTTEIGRPTARQIIWRNALRVVEVGVGAAGWIVTLMMLVMLTRNRQRIGDLLAGTIVVTLGVAPPDQPPGRDDEQHPPSS